MKKIKVIDAEGNEILDLKFTSVRKESIQSKEDLHYLFKVVVMLGETLSISFYMSLFSILKIDANGEFIGKEVRLLLVKLALLECNIEYNTISEL